MVFLIVHYLSNRWAPVPLGLFWIFSIDDGDVLMLVSIKDDAIHNWHDDQNVYVYTADNRCLKLCKVRDLNLFHGDRTIFVEPVDDNY